MYNIQIFSKESKIQSNSRLYGIQQKFSLRSSPKFPYKTRVIRQNSTRPTKNTKLLFFTRFASLACVENSRKLKYFWLCSGKFVKFCETAKAISKFLKLQIFIVSQISVWLVKHGKCISTFFYYWFDVCYELFKASLWFH